MSLGGVPLSAFIQRHREIGAEVPLDVCLVIGAQMARAATDSAVVGFDGGLEPSASEASPRAFGAAFFELLTLKPFEGDADVGDERHDAPPALVELMFELLSGEAAWSDVADRLDAMRDDGEGSARELARYMRRIFEPPSTTAVSSSLAARAPALKPTGERAPLLGGALDEEIGRFDLRVARACQAMTAGGFIIAAVAGLTVSPSLGLWSCAYLVLLFGWFTFYASMLRADRASRRLTMVATALESLLPWPYALLAYYTEGAGYALSSWVVPFLVTFIIGASIARLRPVAPIVVGAVGGVMLIILYFAVLRPGLSPQEALNPACQPSMQFTRGASLVMAGVLAAMIARALRSAIGSAERTQRQRDLFGKYRLLDPIAFGGMGAVYEALYCPEGGFERRVAVKKIHPHLASERRFVEAFRREAELAAHLAHPNIVQVLDFGQVEGSYFIAMEYVDGATLRDIVQSHPQLSPQLVAYIGHEILSALAHAHGGVRGDAPLRIIHRDLSPANVLVSRHGEVKITDFGVAKALHEATQTVTATVAGHYAYMAPEQTTSDPLDERCDLFAVGVVLWELLVGRRLFARDEPAATLLAVMHDEIPRASSLRSELDPAWDELLEIALVRDRDARVGSAAEMLRMLSPILTAAGGPCGPELGAMASETAHARP